MVNNLKSVIDERYNSASSYKYLNYIVIVSAYRLVESYMKQNIKDIERVAADT
jgi:hypothetical protein